MWPGWIHQREQSPWDKPRDIHNPLSPSQLSYESQLCSCWDKAKTTLLHLQGAHEMPHNEQPIHPRGRTVCGDVPQDGRSGGLRGDDLHARVVEHAGALLDGLMGAGRDGRVLVAVRVRGGTATGLLCTWGQTAKDSALHSGVPTPPPPSKAPRCGASSAPQPTRSPDRRVLHRGGNKDGFFTLPLTLTLPISFPL